MRIKKGDKVKIITGKDRGKVGGVLAVFPEEEKLTIDGLNLYKKKSKPKKQGQKGEIISVPRPLPASNVMLICPSCKEPTRLGFLSEGGKKVRQCKKCKASIK